MFVIAYRFFTSTHLHAFSRLEKCMHTDHCVRFRGLNIRGSLVHPLDCGVRSVLGKGACREV